MERLFLSLLLYAKPNADLFSRYRNQPERTFLRSLCTIYVLSRFDFDDESLSPSWKRRAVYFFASNHL